MRTSRMLPLAVLLLAVGASPALATPAPSASPSVTPSVTAASTTEATTVSGRVGLGFVVVHGAVRRPRLLTTRALDSLPQRTVTTSYTAGGVPVTSSFTGPTLLDVVQLAEPRFDEAVKNDPLGFAVRATAGDRYRAVVAWGEVDPGFARSPVLVATSENGRRLDRPRLVVPDDLKGGRYVSDLVDLTLVDLGG